MAKELDQLLRDRAGLPVVPENQNLYKDHLPEIKTPRPGTPGKTDDINITRPGELGNYSEIDIKRGGEEGSELDLQYEPHYERVIKGKLKVERPEEESKVLPNIDNSRGGDLGSTSEIKLNRPKKTTQESDIEYQIHKKDTQLGGITATRPAKIVKDSDIEYQVHEKDTQLDGVEVNRGGDPGELTEIEVTRPGAPGEVSEINVQRPSNNVVLNELLRAGIPEDQNRFSFSDTEEDFITGFLDRLNSIARQTSLVTGTAGFNIPDLSNVSSVLNLLFPTDSQGNKTYQLLSNVSGLINIDVLGYFKHLMSNEWNLARLPLDIGLRELLKAKHNELVNRKKLPPGLKTPTKPGQVLSDTDYEINKEIYDSYTASVHKKTDSRHPIDQIKHQLDDKNLAYDPLEQYYGYSLYWDGSDHTELTWRVRDLFEILDPSKFEEKDIGRLSELKDKNIFFSGDYNRWKGFEMSDDMYWGVRVGKYHPANSKNLLPEFPKEFSEESGWWPITSLSFTKASLKSKTFAFPFFSLTVPYSNERPSKLRVTVLDNSRKSIRYWLEEYVNTCFNLDENIVLPYKNICWVFTVYRYDMTLATLYSKKLICLLAEFNAGFNGATSHADDEINLDFEIVGEYYQENKNSRVNYNF